MLIALGVGETPPPATATPVTRFGQVQATFSNQLVAQVCLLCRSKTNNMQNCKKSFDIIVISLMSQHSSK
jgi:hypothetical protein